MSQLTVTRSAPWYTVSMRRWLPVTLPSRPGDPLRFVAVELEAAEEMCRKAEREFAKLVAALEPVPNDNGLDIRSLYGENLISGVTAGFE